MDEQIPNAPTPTDTKVRLIQAVVLFVTLLVVAGAYFWVTKNPGINLKSSEPTAVPEVGINKLYKAGLTQPPSVSNQTQLSLSQLPTEFSGFILSGNKNQTVMQVNFANGSSGYQIKYQVGGIMPQLFQDFKNAGAKEWKFEKGGYNDKDGVLNFSNSKYEVSIEISLNDQKNYSIVVTAYSR